MKYPNSEKSDLSLPSLRPAARAAVFTDFLNPALPTQPVYKGEKEEGIGLLDYLRILARHKWLWIAFALGGALVGYALTFPQTPQYQASTSLEFVGLNQDFLNLKGTSPITPDAGVSPSDNVSEIQTQIKLLESESLAQRVITQLKLHPTAINKPDSHLPAIRQFFLRVRGNKPASLDELLKLAAKTINAKPLGQTRIVQITVDSSDPEIASAFANTLAAEFIQQNLESRWKIAQNTSDWLTKQLDEMRLKLQKSQQALQQYAEKTGLIFTGERDSVSESRLRQLQQELSAAQADRIAKQSSVEMLQRSSPDTVQQVLDDPGLRDIRSKILELRRQVAELRATYKPEYIKLQRAEAELNTLETAFDRGKQEILNGLQTQYEQAIRKESLLVQAYNSQALRVTEDGEKSIQYNILRHEVESNQQLYQNMLENLNESTLAAAMRASNARVVDSAKTPRLPYKPKAVRTTAFGFLAGAFFGAAFLVIRDQADRTIQQPGETSLLLRTSELGIIPAISTKVLSHGLRPQLGQAFGVESLLGGDSSQAVAWGPPTFLASDSFRYTLLSILLSPEEREKRKIIVITSAGPKEGKSTVASSLAIAAAELGKKVLLVDGDLRKSSLHEVFQISNERGLSTVLLQMASLNGDKSLDGILKETQVSGLHILPSGPCTSTATRLLYTAYARSLFRYLRREFDLIFVDTPPALHIPDARVLGSIADNVVVIVRAGQTTRDAVLATYQRLSEDGSRLLGTVLNYWDPRSGSTGTRYHYAEYYERISVSNNSKPF